jgi:hypothetical protein
METSDIIIAVLIVLLFFTFAGHLVVVQTNPNPQPQPQPQPQPVPVPVPVPYPQPIGGCAGTMYGCCPDGRTPKMDATGLNCN